MKAKIQISMDNEPGSMPSNFMTLLVSLALSFQSFYI